MNKYNILVKLKNGAWVKYHKVNNLVKFCKFLDDKFLNEEKWLFCNVYDRESKRYLGSYLNGDTPTRPSGGYEL